MSSLWKNIKIKKGLGGAGQISEEQKNLTIGKAVSIWEKFGLSKEEISFGVATMNIESGFNPNAKYPGQGYTASGLGQFTDATWYDAIREYNDKYRSESDPKIYPDVNRTDTDAQIRAMGAWISKVWDSALGFTGDSLLKNFTVPEIAYGLWHKSAYTKKASVIKDGIEEVLTNPTNDYYFHHTYIETNNGLDVREILSQSNKEKSFPSGTKRQSDQTNGFTGETLQRQGDQIWRIGPDGGTRGYFISQ